MKRDHSNLEELRQELLYLVERGIIRPWVRRVANAVAGTAGRILLMRLATRKAWES